MRYIMKQQHSTTFLPATAKVLARSISADALCPTLSESDSRTEKPVTAAAEDYTYTVCLAGIRRRTTHTADTIERGAAGFCRDPEAARRIAADNAADRAFAVAAASVSLAGAWRALHHKRNASASDAAAEVGVPFGSMRTGPVQSFHYRIASPAPFEQGEAASLGGGETYLNCRGADRSECVRASRRHRPSVRRGSIVVHANRRRESGPL